MGKFNHSASGFAKGCPRTETERFRLASVCRSKPIVVEPTNEDPGTRAPKSSIHHSLCEFSNLCFPWKERVGRPKGGGGGNLGALSVDKPEGVKLAPAGTYNCLQALSPAVVSWLLTRSLERSSEDGKDGKREKKGENLMLSALVVLCVCWANCNLL